MLKLHFRSFNNESGLPWMLWFLHLWHRPDILMSCTAYSQPLLKMRTGNYYVCWFPLTAESLRKPQNQLTWVQCRKALLIFCQTGELHPNRAEKNQHLQDRRRQQTKQAQHLLGGELCLPWSKEVTRLLCGLASATLNSSLSNSHITWTQNHLVWFLAPAGPYHNATEEGELWSRSHRSAQRVSALCFEQIQ